LTESQIDLQDRLKKL